jgi:N-acetyl-gamma-glutamyl-phosphate reductase
VPDPRTAVVGAAGYSGAVAAAILHRHPGVELTALTARSDAGRRHDELYPAHRVPLVMEEFDPDAISERADAALVAYPHKAAAGAVKALRERGLKVVDLSADFRLDRDAYERWYQPHEAPELLGEAVYGLPEAHREEIREASLVAGPGCNSTAALLALLPLRGRIEEAVVDIKAGVSGAGREATEETHYVSAIDNVNAYKIEGHRHSAEMEQELPGTRFAFLTHLLPVDQGIFASCYATLSEPLTGDELRALYEERYADEPFVDLLPGSPRTQNVRNTNRGQVHVTLVGERVIALAAIDNLWKGAAGQAVQDLNLMLGLPETAGLE